MTKYCQCCGAEVPDDRELCEICYVNSIILEMDVDEYIEYCSKYEDYEPFECHNDGECGGCPDFCDCPIIFNDDDDDDDCYDFDDDDDF